MSRSALLLLTAAGCLIGAWVGHQLGRNSVASPAPPVTAADPIAEPSKPTPPPLDATAWISSVIDSARDRDEAGFRAALAAVSSLDDAQLDSALSETKRHHNRDERRTLFSSLLRELAKRDPEKAVLYLRDEAGSESWNHVSAVFDPIIESSSPAAALALYHEHGLNSQGQLGISSLFPIFSKFGHHDIDGAIAATEMITSRSQRSQMISSLCESSTDPAKRAKLLDWASTLNDEDDQRRAHENLIEIWARRESPETALAWVDENMTAPAAIAAAEHAIADVMMGDDPRAAADWLMGRATDANRADHLAHAIRRWANDAPNAAGEWLGQQPLDATADKALSRFARTIEREDPESAHAWTLRITDAELRERTLEEVMMHWRRRDPQAAAAAAGAN